MPQTEPPLHNNQLFTASGTPVAPRNESKRPDRTERQRWDDRSTSEDRPMPRERPDFTTTRLRQIGVYGVHGWIQARYLRKAGLTHGDQVTLCWDTDARDQLMVALARDAGVNGTTLVRASHGMAWFPVENAPEFVQHLFVVRDSRSYVPDRVSIQLTDDGKRVIALEGAVLTGVFEALHP